MLVVERGVITQRLPIENEGTTIAVARVHGAGTARIATEYYGHVLHYDDATGVFRIAGGTDDIISDAFVRRDETGISLHGGYGLHFDPNDQRHEFVDGLLAMRVSRRADQDAWFVGTRTATHLGPGGFEAQIALPASYGEDVDARTDSVWVVGFDGAAVLTDQGFCSVTPLPDPR